jgi:hypothetical protein
VIHMPGLIPVGPNPLGLPLNPVTNIERDFR